MGAEEEMVNSLKKLYSNFKEEPKELNKLPKGKKELILITVIMYCCVMFGYALLVIRE